MIIDVHSHLSTLEQWGPEFCKAFGGTYSGSGIDLHGTPERHFAETQPADRVIVFGRPVHPPRPASRARLTHDSFIDRLVWDKLEQLGVQPSGFADDATFLRRVFQDTIGTLPTPEQARRFLADTDPDRRTKLIDYVLDRDEYADYWTMRWSDILMGLMFN